MANKKLTGGFCVEFEEFDDGCNNAYLSKTINHRAYTGSLAYVEDCGQLDGGSGAAIDVPNSILNMALKWAEKQGY